MSQLGRLERLAWLIIGLVIAGCLVWQTVSEELSRRTTREFMEMSLQASQAERIVASKVVREGPVYDVPVRAIPGSGQEIVTGKVTEIVPPDTTGMTLADVAPATPPGLTRIVEVAGVGPGSEVHDLASGVYTATIYGDTFALDVTMESVDGRSRFGWGHIESLSFAVGDHADAELFAGPTRITVNSPGDDVRWGIAIDRLVAESGASIMVELVGDEAAIADLSPGLWRVDLLWTSGQQPPNWVWDASIESVAGFGGGSWGGRCTVIHVGPSASQPFSGFRLDPGEVAVTANVPPDFTWAVAFTPFPTGADDDGECLW